MMEPVITKDKPLATQYYRDGKVFQFKYWDTDSFDDLELEKIRQIYGVCFYQDKMVVVLNGKAGTWGLVGGTREEGESVEETLVREVKEESNTEVLSWKPVGVQQVTELLTLSETCQILKVHPNTLRKWDKKGILKAVRFGERGDRRYRKEDIMSFMNSTHKEV